MADSPVVQRRKAKEPAEPKPAVPAPAPAAPPPTPVPAPAPVAAPPPVGDPASPAAPAQHVAAPEGPAQAKPNKGLQFLVESLSILSFLLMAYIPLARFGFVPGGDTILMLVLVGASIMLTTAVLLFGPANYAAKKRSFNEQMLKKYRRDMILTSLSVGGTVVVALMTLLEAAALLAFIGVIDAQSEASIAFADNYVLFATFTLLFCSMLIIVRTSFETRQELKSWHKGVALGLLAFGAVISIVSLLVSFGLLTRGPFAGIAPRQSVYIFTVSVLFQIIAFKMLLRYPAIAQIVVKEMEAARRANREIRDQIQRRALRAYMVGLAFVLISMFLLGGVATQTLPVQSSRSLNFIAVAYVILGVIVFGVILTRYFQQRFLEARARRQQAGEAIAKKRMSKEDMTRRIIFVVSGALGGVFTLIGLLVLTGLLDIFPAEYGTDWLILAFLVGLGPYGWYHGQRLKRIRAMDDKFPDFLRDLAESERAGMTLPRALQTASKGVYGALTGEIRRMSAQVEWGVSFTEALQRFAKRVNTPLIQRTVALIAEASKAGGNVIDILTAASDDAREIKQILEERKRQMGIYGIIIYISFFVFLVVVFILAAQFLPAFSAAAAKGSGAQVSGATIAVFSVSAFTTIFFHAALVQAIGGGLVSGIMQDGHPLYGLKHSIIMSVIAWACFAYIRTI